MKKRTIFAIVVLLITGICNVIYAKYILTTNFNMKITTEPFYLEASIEESIVLLKDKEVEINIAIKNNNGNQYNLEDTRYEIYLEDDSKFSIAVNDETNGVIQGNSSKSNEVTVKLTHNETEQLQQKEQLSIIIKSTYPYEKEIVVPINIMEKVRNYNYINNVQTFVAPVDGVYKMEVWGAQGGNSLNNYIGGYGAYSTGEIQLVEGEVLYVVVGGQGGGASLTEDSPGGYNGGGKGGVSLYDDWNYVTGGGGATHIATKDGLLQSLATHISEILIVAGGGGGGYYHEFGEEASNNGGCAGGYYGNDGVQCTYDKKMLPGTGGSQTAGGTGGYRGYDGIFGKGGDGSSDIDFGTASTDYGASGGGGGFYGGGASAHSGTGGGSGYIANSKLINKYMVCYKGRTSNEAITKTISNENISESAITDYSKIGNGYAKITYIGN